MPYEKKNSGNTPVEIQFEQIVQKLGPRRRLAEIGNAGRRITAALLDKIGNPELANIIHPEQQEPPFREFPTFTALVDYLETVPFPPSKTHREHELREIFSYMGEIWYSARKAGMGAQIFFADQIAESDKHQRHIYARLLSTLRAVLHAEHTGNTSSNYQSTGFIYLGREVNGNTVHQIARETKQGREYEEKDIDLTISYELGQAEWSRVGEEYEGIPPVERLHSQPNAVSVRRVFSVKSIVHNNAEIFLLNKDPEQIPQGLRTQNIPQEEKASTALVNGLQQLSQGWERVITPETRVALERNFR